MKENNMPLFYEVYGACLSDASEQAEFQRRNALCPYTNSLCDGGGNRHQTAIKLDQSPLKSYFSDNLKRVVPGICSIGYGSDAWIVCPRRLLGFNNESDKTIPDTNASLQEHERKALLAAGVPSGIRLGVWSEVYLQFKEDGTDINYHFDFVIAPIEENTSFEWLLNHENIEGSEEADLLWDSAKKGGYLAGTKSVQATVPVLPKLDQPFIFEVMTASTSGSKKENRTDISSSFEDALLSKEYNCPGINKRQVWGRMATQLFAKSALAEAWGGKTIWMVQDQLLKNIELTTKLTMSQPNTAKSSTINFLCMAYNSTPGNNKKVELKSYVERDAGLDFSANNQAADILLPKKCPEKIELVKSVLRRKLSAIIEL
jgi:hypothetical protein